MEDRSAIVFVTKLGAAERQLNAAIRMTLIDEDELAIHTIASASYRVLRDLKEKRGRSDAYDIFHKGIYDIASDLENGSLAAIPKEISEGGPSLLAILHHVRQQIRRGEIKNWNDVPPIYMREEGTFWSEFNRPFNFLKHGENDPEAILDISTINNDELLVRACSCYVEITHRTTPEIMAHYMYYAGFCDFSLLPEETRSALARLTPAQRRRKCRSWLKKARLGAVPSGL